MVFLLEDPSGKRFGIILFVHRNRFLQHDWAAVKFGAHQVHRRPGPFHAVFPRLILRVDSRKCGQQRRMNVDDRLRKSVQEHFREQPHEPGEADQPDVSRLQLSRELEVVGLTRGKPLRVGVIEHHGLKAGLARPRQAGGSRPVGNDDGNLCIQLFRCDRVDDRLEIAAAS